MDAKLKEELKEDFGKLSEDLVALYKDITDELGDVIKDLGEAFSEEPADVSPDETYEYHAIRFNTDQEKMIAVKQILGQGKLMIRRKKSKK